MIEFLVLLLFGFSLRENWKTVLLVNFLTQGLLHGCFSFFALQSGVSWFYFLLFFPAGGGCNADRVVRLRQNAPGKEQTEGSALRHLCERLLGGAGLCACRARVASCREPALRL